MKRIDEFTAIRHQEFIKLKDKKTRVGFLTSEEQKYYEHLLRQFKLEQELKRRYAPIEDETYKSPYIWQDLNKDMFIVPRDNEGMFTISPDAGKTTYFVMRAAKDSDNLWLVAHRVADGPLKKALKEFPTAVAAIKALDAFMRRKHESMILVERGALWMDDLATPKQIAMLEEFRFPFPRHITQGQAEQRLEILRSWGWQPDRRNRRTL